MYADFHMHIIFQRQRSPNGTHDPQCHSQKCAGICFTEHMDFGFSLGEFDFLWICRPISRSLWNSGRSIRTNRDKFPALSLDFSPI